ncbi:MAG: CPBP family intramembrane metalloprotease [Bacteroidales bacterium]|jgi:membrane protease YdiL (CAAX protease family)|nr:CPBP family intramembrane metalloprotease [Bacteroidales bacterium]
MSNLLDFTFLKNKNLFHKIVVFVLLFFFLSIIMPTAIVLILSAISGVGLEDFYNVESESFNINLVKISQVFTQVLVFALGGIIFVRLITKNAGNYLKINHKPKFSLLIISALAIILAIPFTSNIVEWNMSLTFPESLSELENALLASSESSNRIMEEIVFADNFGTLTLNLLIIALIPAICEELLFRGALQSTLQKHIKSVHLSVFIAAFIFSAAHFDFFAFVPRVILGMILGYIFAYSKSLWASIAAHFTNNAISVFVAYFYFSGQTDIKYEDFGSTGNIFVNIILFALSLVTIWLIYKYFGHKKEAYEEA